MSGDDASAEPELQFDHVASSDPGPEAAARPVVVCAGCHAVIDTEYYTVNTRIICDRCRTSIQQFAETPTGLLPVTRATLFGMGAGVAGAIVYFAVIAIAHIEIGIVAILIGYMVGFAVRKGARGRGGLRFQIVAVALTYLAVGMAYVPLAFSAAVAQQQETRPAAAAHAGIASAAARQAPQRPTIRMLATLIAILFGMMAALPMVAVIGGLPTSLISAFIIFIGMRQAWRMTGGAVIDVFGPYRVGAAATVPS